MCLRNKFSGKGLRILWGIFASLGILVTTITLVALVFSLTEEVLSGDRIRRREYTDKHSSVVWEVSKRGGTNIVNGKTGKTILSHAWIYTNSTNDSLSIFVWKDKRGYINLNTGNIDIPADTYSAAWIFSNGLAAVVKDDYIGFIRPNGSVAIPFKFAYRDNKRRDIVFKNNYCAMADSSMRWGIIDTTGHWVIKPQYESIELSKDYFVAGIAGQFKKQMKYDGTILNDCVVDNIEDISYDYNYEDRIYGGPNEGTAVSQEYFKYRVSGRYGLMDKSGTYITQPLYENLYGFGPDKFRAILLGTKSEIIINTQGQIISKQK